MILRGDFFSEVLRTTTNIQFLIPEPNLTPKNGIRFDEETNSSALCPDDKTYRVVYLLHGLHGNQGTWLDRTMLSVYAKKYNAIFVMPEAGRSFYVNLKYGRKYQDFMCDELPNICQRIFNISSMREDTAVIGCSMGGFGALRLALSGQQFGFCGAISPACLYFKTVLDEIREDTSSLLEKGGEASDILSDLYAIFSEKLEFRPDFDIPELAKNFPLSMPKPKIFVTCGTEDDLRKENLDFKDEMQKTDFDFTYEEWTGGHDWYFFNDALKRTLELWYANA